MNEPHVYDTYPMRSIFLLVLILSFHLAQSQPPPCERDIEGQVLDRQTGEPLPFATVTIAGQTYGVVADDEGYFVLKEVCDPEVDLVVRFLGYKTMRHHHDFYHGDPIIYLAPDDTQLESITVENSRLGEMESLAIQKMDIVKGAIVNTSIGALSEELTGVSLLKTGSNIAKPIIHGLHSNRVLVINDGVRHGYQVWGLEHAPEIDPSHVDQIEIVKGAGTVKYGPEALGGVILYNSKRPSLDEKFNGSIQQDIKPMARRQAAS